MAPALLPSMVVISFTFTYFVHRHQVINVYTQEYESAAAFWPDVHRKIVTSLAISQLALILRLLSTNKRTATLYIPLLILVVPLVLTFYFHKFCKSRYESAFVGYPLDEAMRKDNLHPVSESNINMKEYLEDAYLNPILKQKEEELEGEGEGEGGEGEIVGVVVDKDTLDLVRGEGEGEIVEVVVDKDTLDLVRGEGEGEGEGDIVEVVVDKDTLDLVREEGEGEGKGEGEIVEVVVDKDTLDLVREEGEGEGEGLEVRVDKDIPHRGTHHGGDPCNHFQELNLTLEGEGEISEVVVAKDTPHRGSDPSKHLQELHMILEEEEGGGGGGGGE